MERWKAVHGFSRYEVSDLGRVRSVCFGRGSSPRVLKVKVHKAGYSEVGLYDGPKADGGKQCTRLIHRLVLTSFVGPPGAGEVCRHLDGDPGNNSLSNLAWGTQSENWHDARSHGSEATCKLADDQVRSIRARYIAGCGKRIGNGRELAVEFGVHRRTIWSVATRRAYAWIE